MALDFDGVIFDSSKEAFTISIRTYAGLKPRSTLARHPLAQAADDAPVAFDFTNDTVYDRFMDIVPLGNRAEDFGVALAIIDHGLPVTTQEAYNTVFAASDGAWRKAFHKRFYYERNRLRASDLEGWLRLQIPYRHFTNLLETHRPHTFSAIVTARDSASVNALLSAYHLDSLFSPAQIYDKDNGSDKRHHVRKLIHDLGTHRHHITFIDDKLNHVQAVASLGIRSILAGWGHNTARERDRARQLGFPVAEPETAERLLFGGGA